MCETQGRVLALDDITWSKEQLHIVADVDGVKHTVDIWYGFDLDCLEREYGTEFMTRVYFNIASIHMLKLLSLRPAVLSFGARFAKYDTKDFREFWNDLTINGLSQWRYESDLPNWKGPMFLQEKPSDGSTLPFPVEARRVEKQASPTVPAGVEGDRSSVPPVTTLVSVSGGKDSLLATKLLERKGVPHAAYSFHTSCYGLPETQEKRLVKVLNHCSVTDWHKVQMFDAFKNLPEGTWTQDASFRGTATAVAEINNICFVALPIMLYYGYSDMVVANERGSNLGNFKWDREGGLEVNHQYSKGYRAEIKINEYVSKTMISNYNYYSILQPISDVVIFYLLRQHLDVLVHSHSCNFYPPWCNRCPKCCYIWLQLQAYMPSDAINPMFGNENLFDVEDNVGLFRDMLGLTGLKPFECIGDFVEAQLAFERCYRKGMKGKAMDIFVEKVLNSSSFDWKQIVETCSTVHKEEHRIPKAIAEYVIPLYEEVSQAVRKELLCATSKDSQKRS